MPDWKSYLRENLPPLTLGPERESEMVDEMAQHLEAVYEDSLADGLSEQEAYRRAVAHINDWQLLECELIRAKRPIASTWSTTVSPGKQESNRKTEPEEL